MQLKALKVTILLYGMYFYHHISKAKKLRYWRPRKEQKINEIKNFR